MRQILNLYILFLLSFSFLSFMYSLTPSFALILLTMSALLFFLHPFLFPYLAHPSFDSSVSMFLSFFKSFYGILYFPSHPPFLIFRSFLFISPLSLSPVLPVALGRNQPLKRERPKWKSDYPMTEGQLRSKRDEFWDTAPAFEGRKEIWDALRAAASAFESSDHLLAQAILDGASITLPHGNIHRQRERRQIPHSVSFAPNEIQLGGLYVRYCR